MYGRGHFHPVVVKLIDLVERDITALQRSVGCIAEELNVSTCHLQHMIRRDLNMSLTHFIRRRRVALVRRMMRERPDLTISEVAFACGYETTKLYRHFMIELSASPSEVRIRDAASTSGDSSDETDHSAGDTGAARLA